MTEHDLPIVGEVVRLADRTARFDQWFAFGALVVFVGLIAVAVLALGRTPESGPAVRIESVVREQVCHAMSGTSAQADFLVESAAYLQTLGGPDREAIAARLIDTAEQMRRAAATYDC